MSKRNKLKKGISKLNRVDKVRNLGLKLGIREDYMDALIGAYESDSIEFFDNLCDENLNEEQINFIHAYFNW